MILKNPYQSFNTARIWQEGWDARCKWEQEPCTEHLYQLSGAIYNGIYVKDEPVYPKHRYLCPVCLEELKKNAEEKCMAELERRVKGIIFVAERISQ